ncbi:SDR family oxidoreductase [Micromonospora soli]|uniref:SDR family oxidoreductase n=1 Tax=Micromonospora sp. NBRC 110009 TaxID=3061627 RepID=UPI0026726364|nr:SDR family oxidoreductase [Micromonospora sp. NBRC 110009]WKT97849.1 SDR family oxidoreductase [Micromonospora sp. NBRC 110009]
MPQQYEDYDRIAIVTGADSGIGKACAVALAEAGFDIGITWYGDPDGADRTATEVRATGRRCEVAEADLTRLPGAAAVVDQLADRLGGLGVLVNNAGTGLATPFVEVSWAQWREVLQVDLDGPFLCSQRAARRMRTACRGGRIISITSVHEHAPRVGSSAYCAAKGGLGLLTKVMAQELAADGITVNAVAPGEIATPMTGQEDIDPGTQARPGVPVGRPGDAREVAAVVALLASPAAAYVTGASWPVDGGMLLMGPQANALTSNDWRTV